MMGTSTKPVVESFSFHAPTPSDWPSLPTADATAATDLILYPKDLSPPVYGSERRVEEARTRDKVWRRPATSSGGTRKPNSRQNARPRRPPPRPTARVANVTDVPEYVRDYRPQSNDHTPRVTYHTLPPDFAAAPVRRVKNCSEVLYKYNPSEHYIIGWKNVTTDDLGIPPNKGANLEDWTLVMYGTSGRSWDANRQAREGTCLMYNSAAAASLACSIHVFILILLMLR
ncbi:PREDICTED: uncharacterized protein LOC106808572 [Priapulus caudatus]|uniref:Uncharacterized protein LOC106808572 n=1 Tax=Priapulus caudatus TaxID=37621 RepID=A0ABM1E3P8_PRICU|nr:PREDICTED: uncharacterized protein LOC106808572 [Priapulus caudatus]